MTLLFAKNQKEVIPTKPPPLYSVLGMENSNKNPAIPRRRSIMERGRDNLHDIIIGHAAVVAAVKTMGQAFSKIAI